MAGVLSEPCVCASSVSSYDKQCRVGHSNTQPRIRCLRGGLTWPRSPTVLTRQVCGAQVRSTGPINAQTHQPIKGRKFGGGIRFGEMERDALLVG